MELEVPGPLLFKTSGNSAFLYILLSWAIINSLPLILVFVLAAFNSSSFLSMFFDVYIFTVRLLLLSKTPL